MPYSLGCCLALVLVWTRTKKLKLNLDKREILLLEDHVRGNSP